MCVVEAHWPRTRTRRRFQSSEMKTPGAWHTQIHPIRPTTSRLSSFFSRMRSEGFPFIVWASGGLGAGPLFAVVCAGGSRADRGRVGNSVLWGLVVGVSCG